MKAELLKVLRNTEDYVSGQDLCKRFGVSRTAVWKVMNQLKEEGYEIEAVQNKGYKIVRYPDAITSHEIGSLIQGNWAGKEIFSYKTIDSTNIKARRLAEEGVPHGTLVVAGRQINGRGRRGRNWDSMDSGIWMTLLLRPELNPSKASALTLVMGLSIAKAISKAIGEKVSVKWPNDILLHGKKIAGILTEMNAEMDFIHSLAIGVGINANTDSFPEVLIGKASSLYLETKQPVHRAGLIACCLKQFEDEYEKFLQTEDLSGLCKEFDEYLINRNRMVKVLGRGETLEGLALGINHKGELLVKEKNGNIVEVYAGEVSVRGILGYAE